MAGDWEAADDLAGVLTAVRRQAGPRWCRLPLQRLRAAVRAAAAGGASATPSTARAGNIAPPLRPLQRAVRALPRRDDDLLAARSSSRATRWPSAQRRKYEAICRHGRPAAGRPSARDRHRLGRHGRRTPPRTRGCRVTSATLSPSQRELGAAADRGGRASTTGWRSCSATTASSTGHVSTAGLDRDVRGRRRGVLADLLRRLRPAARARRPDRRCRPSPCRTSATGPPAGSTAGSTSTSSRRPDPLAGGDRRGGRARRSALRVRAPVEIGSHYAPTLRAWRERFLANAERVRGLGFDDRVRADVGVLPGLLRGRVRDRRAGRRADAAARAGAC